ncbi:MAG: lipid-A-disaccharide synthase [Robiginitomaculum sp.]|nr:MAG: lipid-A-disaccharide synthase [Robiginitomaculum sp.]
MMRREASSRLFVIAGEPSGDQLGARFIDAIRNVQSETVEIGGVGGPKMAKLGVKSPIDIRPLSVLGLVDGLLAYPNVRKLVAATVAQVVLFKPDLVVLIDSWGFTLRVAHQIRKILPDTILVKYVGPQVFATRPGRAKVTAETYDHLLTIHSFDGKYFKSEGLDTTFVGNPAISAVQKVDDQAFQQKYNPAGQPVLSAFFGSRPGEIKFLMEPFLRAIEQIKSNHPDLVVVAPLSDNIAIMVRSLVAHEPRLQDIILLDEAEKSVVFTASTLALACSGTVTLELANAGVPMVIGYRLSPVSGYLMEKFVFKAQFANLINLAANQEIIPEFLSSKCTGPALAKALGLLLNDPKLRGHQQKAAQKTLIKMQSTKGNVSQVAAKKVLELMD